MAGIQTGIGLITGVPIADTVDKLIALSARPRDLITERNTQLKNEQVAITDLTALLIGVQFAADKLDKASVFSELTASSSDAGRLSATVTGQAAAGAYQYTPVRQAQVQQLLSTGVADPDAPLGEGVLSFRFGGFVDEGISLGELNSGNGVRRGKIRITDRSGADAIVDLRFAKTVDDVLDAINAADGISVRAVAYGDAIRLIDETGESVANLRVREVGQGSTAADLGLAGIDVAAGVATGQDLVRLHDRLTLAQLNDGNGVSLRAGLPDLKVTFRDGSTPLQIDLELDGGQQATVGDLIREINNADPARLLARISADGDRIELVDLTADQGGVFSVSSLFGGSAAKDLGLTGASSGDVLASRRLLAGLKSSLLSSLNGGAGLGPLGQLDITDRSGAAASVDLSSAETLEDVISAINGAGVGVTARIHDARNGLLLTDVTGSTTGRLIVSSGDAAQSAEKLGIAVDAETALVNSGSLHLQLFNEHLKLDSLNNGQGVPGGSLKILDSNGATGTVNLAVAGVKTVGDVLDRINGLGIGVKARINETGDGILLVDTAGGAGPLRVTDSGSGTAAALKLAGQSVIAEIDGAPTKVIDGTTTLRVEIEAGDSLQDLIDKINALGAGVSAAAFHDGSAAAPHRLSLVSRISGKAGELLIDTSQLGLTFQEIAPAQDALLLVGSSDSQGAGALASSSSNVFKNVLPGVSLTVQGASADPVTITVQKTDNTLVANVKGFVNQFNKLRDKMSELTFFNETDATTGILFGTTEALRIETGLAGLLSGRFFGAGAIQSLEALGVGLTNEGKLAFNEQKLQDQFEEDPEAVEEFFTKEELGLSAKVSAFIDTLAGEDNSLLVNTSMSLQSKIEFNEDRIAFHNKRLEHERELLLSHFYGLEEAIANLKANMTAIDSIRPLQMLYSTE